MTKQKFRAFYSNNGVKDEMVYFPELAWMCTNGNIGIEAISDAFQRHEVGPSGIEIWWKHMSPLMQWTGMLDKNKVEVYAGDIVKRLCLDNNCDMEHVGVVQYNDMWLHWEIKEKNTPGEKVSYYPPLAYGNPGQGVVLAVEVLGNTYQNPELMKTYGIKN